MSKILGVLGLCALLVPFASGFGVNFHSGSIGSALPGTVGSSSSVGSAPGSEPNLDASIGVPSAGTGSEDAGSDGPPPTFGGNALLSENAERSRRKSSYRNDLIKTLERLDVLEKYFRDVGVLPPAEEEEVVEEEVSRGGFSIPQTQKTRMTTDQMLADIEARTAALKEAIDSYESPDSPGAIDGGVDGGVDGGDGGEGGGEIPFVDSFTEGIEIRFSDRKWIGFIDSSKAEDASGIAHSRIHDDILYLVNDSGDNHVVVIDSTTGEYLNRIDIEGHSSVDYEDLAVGPCLYADDPDRSCIYIADTGRSPRNVVRLPEPADPRNADDISVDAEWPVDYSSSIEAMFVTPTGDIYLMSETHPADFMRINRDTKTTKIWEECTEMKSESGSEPSAAAISSDGTIVLIKTNDYVTLFYVPDGDYSGVICDESQHILLDYTPEEQGQNMAFLPGDYSYVTTAEVTYAALWRYDKLKVSEVSDP